MPAEFTESRLLVVEGPADEMLFQYLIRHLRLAGIQIHNIGGVTNLEQELLSLTQTPGFHDEVKSLGIVRDADDDSESAFDSVRVALEQCGLPAPAEPLEASGNDPSVTVLIVPHGESSGALDDVCLASVADDPVMQCVEDYIDCMLDAVDAQPNNLSKSRLQAFLSSRREPGMLLGAAARANYWNFDHPSFNPIKELLRML